MSNVTITSFASSPSNITISESLNQSTTVTTIDSNISVVTIDQGPVGPPGPPGPIGPPGTGISINNYGHYRLLTSDGTPHGIDAESSLLFNSTGLYVSGTLVSISGHNHNISDIYNLQSALDNKQASGSYSPLFDQSLNSTDTVFFGTLTSPAIYIDSAGPLNGIQFANGSQQFVAYSGSVSASEVYNFSSAVSGLLPVKNIVAGSGINVSSSSGVYTISSINNILSIPSNGRLTLQSGDPAYYNDISGSVLYFTPYFGNYIGLYNTINNKWESFNFTEISLSLTGMINNTNYDIFLFNNGGTLTLERVAWSNNSTRSVNLIYQDGILVRSGSINKRYVGTIRSTSTTTTEDSISRRFVYNHNNQITKPLNISDSVSHTYATTAVRPYRNITTVGTTRAELVSGQNIFTNIICTSNFTTQSNSSSVGVSVDSTGVFNTRAVNTTTITSGALASTMVDNSIDNVGISIGYHYIQLLESGSSISTFNSASFRVLLLC